nr:MAG: hypothetical protein [Caudoviricetes sp.]
MGTAKNDVTGNLIKTKGVGQKYRDNYDLIFRSKDSSANSAATINS